MSRSNRSPWAWVPTLYFAEGIPYVVVMTVSVIFYKRMGISNTDIALYTSWLYLPWVIKPLWSPVVDLLKKKRWWIIIMQLLVGAGLAGVALTIPIPSFFQYTLAFFWLLAFSSATHDIAADGFYMLALDEHKQAYFIGIRSTFYRFAMITGQGLLIIVAGSIESRTGLEPVRFEASTQPTEQTDSWIQKNKTYDEEEGEQRFILSKETLYISTSELPAGDAQDMLLWTQEANIEHGFKSKETDINTIGAGNTGLMGIRLSSPPEEGEQIVLLLGRKTGDKNFRLIEGDRLTFTSNNWNKNAWILVQIDPKLNKVSSASFEGLSGNIPFAWLVTFFILAALFVIFFIYHRFILPRPDADKAISEGKNMVVEFLNTFGSFFRKENLAAGIAFFLLFRLGESQLVKLASPFLLDSRESGGLALTTGDVGLIYGTIGIIFLTLGGLLGGYVASRNGLKYWIWWMTLAINLPNLVYVYLSYTTPSQFAVIASGVAIEQFGYGFGFTAYMLYMIYFAEGKSKTAHFAICTGFMALGMMVPGMISGWIQESIGYQNFFIWVMICTIPGFIAVKFLKIDPLFGIKKADK
jgi:PAT family beta-lactamase induction signal transducer AmpG